MQLHSKQFSMFSMKGRSFIHFTITNQNEKIIASILFRQATKTHTQSLQTLVWEEYLCIFQQKTVTWNLLTITKS